MAKKKKADLDMTPVCNKCGKVAPIDKEKSNSNWIFYNTENPWCECGGRWTARCLLEK